MQQTQYTQKDIKDALKVTAAVCGCEISDEVVAIMVFDLKPYGGEAVMRVLSDLRKTHKGRFSLAEIISRLDAQDGRPATEEAWGIALKLLTDERSSVLTTHDIASAAGAARSLIDAGDRVAARLAFKDAYERIVSDSRRDGIAVSWYVSLGESPTEAADVIKRACEKGLITQQAALTMLPNRPEVDEVRGEISGKPLSLEDKRKGAQHIRKALQMLASALPSVGGMSQDGQKC